MQRPTLPPSLWREAVWRWSWTRGGRRGGRRGPGAGGRDITLLEHTPQNINLLREMLRIDSLRRLQPSTGRSVTPLPPPPPLWLSDHLQDPHWRIPDLQAINLPLDRLPVLRPPPAPPRSPVGSAGLAGGAAGAGGAGTARGWEAAARGWGAAALLLVMIIMLVRLSEKCADVGWFKLRRRRSVEWPTPNVLATSNQNNEITDEELDGIDPYSDLTLDVVNTIDRPPPYSECSTESPSDPKPYRDEPPPPYSACFVAFSNPKNGTPSVQFHNDRQDLQRSRPLDTGQSSQSSSVFNESCTRIKPQDSAVTVSGDECDGNREVTLDKDSSDVISDDAHMSSLSTGSLVMVGQQSASVAV